MLIVGLTGGIGSGKSTVGKLLENYGLPLYNSDQRAREIMHESEKIISSLKTWYGEDIYENGILNRKKLGAEVFAHQDQLERLNNLIHPVVYQDFKAWVARQQSGIVIKEAAILFESGAYVQCDYIVTVSAPQELRVQRVMARDATTQKLVLDRIDKQWTDAQREEKADYVLKNDGSLEDLQRQVDILYATLNDELKHAKK